MMIKKIKNSIKHFWKWLFAIIFGGIVLAATLDGVPPEPPIDSPVGESIEIILLEQQVLELGDITITDKIVNFQEKVEAIEECSVVENEEVCEIIKEEIPEKKNIEVKFNYGAEEGSVSINYDGYNMCRQAGNSKSVCLIQLKDQLAKNIRWWKENYEARNAKEQIQEFGGEIEKIDL